MLVSHLYIYITHKIYKEVPHNLLHHITYSFIIRKESLKMLHIHSQRNKAQWMSWHCERRKLYHCESLDLQDSLSYSNRLENMYTEPWKM